MKSDFLTPLFKRKLAVIAALRFFWCNDRSTKSQDLSEQTMFFFDFCPIWNILLTELNQIYSVNQFEYIFTLGSWYVSWKNYINATIHGSIYDSSGYFPICFFNFNKSNKEDTSEQRQRFWSAMESERSRRRFNTANERPCPKLFWRFDRPLQP